MGAAGSKRYNELYEENKPIPFEVFDKIRKCICKIKVSDIDRMAYGTGFFMEYNSSEYLFTNFHLISKKVEKIEIEIWDKKIIKLDLNDRIITYIEEPKDLTIIKLQPKEINNIQTLYYDLNYTRGYQIYMNNYVLGIGYPFADEISIGSGKIKEIINDYEFYHNIPTDIGSSGSPLILFNSLTVIGIHKQADKSKKLNVGTFIGESFEEINKNENEIYISDDENENRNEITCVYDITKKGIFNLLGDFNYEYIDTNAEEKEKLCKEPIENIKKENIDIYINYKKIKFNTKYKIDEPGIINVIFKFRKLLTSTFLMFKDCIYLKSIDLSYFNTSKVTNMRSMFHNCTSIKSINLSSLNTCNVTSMRSMFYNCSSLTTLDFSSFDTSNVTDMRTMFNLCSSLVSLDLSSFNTENVTNMIATFQNCSALNSINLFSFNTKMVTNMSNMFKGCCSLISLDLFSFNTSNVTSMYAMFNRCSSLSHLDLSLFDTSNVIDMSFMFAHCHCYYNIDLSKFNTKNVIKMRHMFGDCYSLTSLDLSSFETTNVTDMRGMFFNCRNLESLDLSSFDTTNVSNMFCMFMGCNIEKKNVKVSKAGEKILDKIDCSIY